MDLDFYSLNADKFYKHFIFISSGPRGEIEKAIRYKEIAPSIFNLSFGDWDAVNKRIDDTSRTNNADRDKILATVAESVLLFIGRTLTQLSLLLDKHRQEPGFTKWR